MCTCACVARHPNLKYSSSKNLSFSLSSSCSYNDCSDLCTCRILDKTILIIIVRFFSRYLDTSEEDLMGHAHARLFCDICDEFDQHDTGDCPQQAQSDSPPPTTTHHMFRSQERPYCENCEGMCVCVCVYIIILFQYLVTGQKNATMKR